MRHHRLLELYLVESLGMGWDEVHAEAERLEHVLSEELEEVIAAKLGNPTLDPHGDPIPEPRARDRRRRRAESLYALEPGEQGTFVGSPIRTRRCCASSASAGSRPARSSS